MKKWIKMKISYLFEKLLTELQEDCIRLELHEKQYNVYVNFIRKLYLKRMHNCYIYKYIYCQVAAKERIKEVNPCNVHMYWYTFLQACLQHSRLHLKISWTCVNCKFLDILSDKTVQNNLLKYKLYTGRILKPKTMCRSWETKVGRHVCTSERWCIFKFCAIWITVMLIASLWTSKSHLL